MRDEGRKVYDGWFTWSARIVEREHRRKPWGARIVRRFGRFSPDVDRTRWFASEAGAQAWATAHLDEIAAKAHAPYDGRPVA